MSGNVGKILEIKIIQEPPAMNVTLIKEKNNNSDSFQPDTNFGAASLVNAFEHNRTSLEKFTAQREEVNLPLVTEETSKQSFNLENFVQQYLPDLDQSEIKEFVNNPKNPNNKVIGLKLLNKIYEENPNWNKPDFHDSNSLRDNQKAISELLAEEEALDQSSIEKILEALSPAIGVPKEYYFKNFDPKELVQELLLNPSPEAKEELLSRIPDKPWPKRIESVLDPNLENPIRKIIFYAFLTSKEGLNLGRVEAEKLMRESNFPSSPIIVKISDKEIRKLKEELEEKGLLSSQRTETLIRILKKERDPDHYYGLGNFLSFEGLSELTRSPKEYVKMFKQFSNTENVYLRGLGEGFFRDIKVMADHYLGKPIEIEEVVTEPSPTPLKIDPIDPEIREAGIEVLDLSTKALRSLKKAGQDTIGKLIRLSPDEVLELRDVGSSDLETILRNLNKKGLSLQKDKGREGFPSELLSLNKEDYSQIKIEELSLPSLLEGCLKKSGVSNVEELLSQREKSRYGLSSYLIEKSYSTYEALLEKFLLKQKLIEPNESLIAVLDLKRGICNNLSRNAEIKTVGDLTNKTRNEILDYKGLSVGSLIDIETALEKVGLSLKRDINQ